MEKEHKFLSDFSKGGVQRRKHTAPDIFTEIPPLFHGFSPCLSKN
ncbi:hypothetical protein [Ruminococcus sp.]